MLTGLLLGSGRVWQGEWGSCATESTDRSTNLGLGITGIRLLPLNLCGCFSNVLYLAAFDASETLHELAALPPGDHRAVMGLEDVLQLVEDSHLAVSFTLRTVQ